MFITNAMFLFVAEPKPQRRRTKKTKAVKVKKEKNKDAGEERSRSRPKEIWDAPAGNKAELAVQHIKASVRKLLQIGKFPASFWPLAALHASERNWHQMSEFLGQQPVPLLPFAMPVHGRKRFATGFDAQWATRTAVRVDHLNKSRDVLVQEKKAAKNAAPESSSSESESSEELSEDTLYKLVKPYTKVMLVNLVRKAELNGMQGQVVHPSTAVCPCPPGCVLVRLETGREIAIKPKNLQMINSWQRVRAA
eukprot:s957_g1.t1